MAVEFCTETSLGWSTSPRISFSHDLHCGAAGNVVPVDRCSNSSLLDSSPDFDFGVLKRCDNEPSTADELFSDGKILPLQFKTSVVAENSVPSPPPPLPPPLPEELTDVKKDGIRYIMMSSEENEKPEPVEKPVAARSFWRFRRSSSLNSGNGHKSSSIWSLQLLSRSKSTGSADHHHHQNSKNMSSRDTHKMLMQKQGLNSNSLNYSNSFRSKSFPPSPSSSSSLPKPPLKKNGSIGKAHHGAYGNGVRISPVLNVPPPYISKGTTNLFGFGHFFCNKKDKRIKRKSISTNTL